METPVLSKLQKKKSLTGKKNKKETIKNVLVDPHRSNWPLVRDELDILSKALKENLPRVKHVKINVPWRILKDVPKDKRKFVRSDYVLKHGPAEKLTKNDGLIFGVNEVTKLLESDSCSAVLVGDIIPRIVVKHVVEMAVLKNIPVLVVSTLKEILKQCCGLESMALAIRSELDPSSNLGSIVKIIFEINKNYPTSLNHINTNRIKSLEDSEKCSKFDKQIDIVDKPVENSNEQHTPNYHLIKISSCKRAFVPEVNKCSNAMIPTELKNICNEFETPAHSIMSKPNINSAHDAIRKKIMLKKYKPLTVKRLKGNKNRQKDKNKLQKTK